MRPAVKIPSVIGHRGACKFAPENTLESIKTASEMGLKWVEFDVKLSKDGIPILFHDDTLDRTTNGSGAVRDMNFEDLKDLEAGQWFAEGFTNVAIPSLEDALDVLLKLNMGANLEIKPCAGREIETAEATLDLLTQVWDDTETMLISSFQMVSMETVLDYAPDYARGFLMPEDWPDNWAEMAEYIQADTIHINGNDCNRDQIEEIMELQKPILAYTINDPMRARQLRQWGVDSVFTDDPETISADFFKNH
jgi:glycerophosphoryl diester phosphodiesterase